MTLLITTLADDAVIQVSDRRLTIMGGKGGPATDEANKAVCIASHDTKCVASYTGIATLDGIRTDYWLVDAIGDLLAEHPAFPELLEQLRGKLSGPSSRLRTIGRMRALTVLFSGFGPRGPFAAMVSNAENSKGETLGDIDDSFVSGMWLRNDKPMSRDALIMAGCTEAVSEQLRVALAKAGKRLFGADPQKRVTALVQALRIAAEHPTCGHLIGKQCISTIVPREGNCLTHYHSVHESWLGYGAHFVTPTQRFKDVYFHLPPGYSIQLGGSAHADGST